MRLPFFLLLVLVAGCAEPAVSDTAAAAPDVTVTSATEDAASDAVDLDGDAAVQPEASARRSEALARPVRLEGESGARPYRLAAFPDFPVPFSTYVPDDATVEQPGSGDAISVAWGDAEVQVSVARGETPDAANARLQAAIPVDPEPVETAWAERAFAYRLATQGPIFHATTFVGLHEGTTFVVGMTVFTDDSIDGLTPAHQIFLDEWRWADGVSL